MSDIEELTKEVKQISIRQEELAEESKRLSVRQKKLLELIEKKNRKQDSHEGTGERGPLDTNGEELRVGDKAVVLTKEPT